MAYVNCKFLNMKDISKSLGLNIRFYKSVSQFNLLLKELYNLQPYHCNKQLLK
jgi:hypothetical protein